MTSMKTFNGKSLLTPKELAETIGASESSIRRWVDAGDIRVARTAGGHRRITLAEAIRFIRQIEAPVVRPEVLGLGEFRANGVHGSDLSEDERLFESLQAADDDGIRSFLVSRYLEGDSLASLFDGPLRTAIRRVGELWEHDKRGILVEHRATEICIDAIGALRRLLPPVEKNSPLALGGAPPGDPYQLPSMMAGAILCESGFRDVNFGPNTPVDLLGREAVERGASLVWLSVSAPCESKLLSTPLRKLALILGKRQIRLILGGRHHREVAPGHLANVMLVQSMTDLVGVAAKLIDKGRNRGDL